MIKRYCLLILVILSCGHDIHGFAKTRDRLLTSCTGAVTNLTTSLGHTVGVGLRQGLKIPDQKTTEAFLSNAFSEGIQQGFGPIIGHASHGISTGLAEGIQRGCSPVIDAASRQASNAAGQAGRAFVRNFAQQARSEETIKDVSVGFDLWGRALVNGICSPRNLGVGAVSIALLASAWYGTSLAWKKIDKPAILLPDSNISMWDKFNRWRSGYTTPEMIMSDDQKERLEEIIEKARIIATRNNLVLTGKPGTGKSLFARYLADKAGLDFMATTAGALFQQNDAIKHIDEMFAMAKKSKNGCVFFIDEADALFVDRNRLDAGSLHYKALNHLLARTGQGNEKFMIVAATNHAQVMDEAMARRFQDHIEMVLPDEKTRKRLVQLYAKTHLFNVKNNGKKFVLEAQKVFTPEIIDQIVRDTPNLSHAEINDIIQAMRNKALSAKVEIAKGTRKKPERLLKVEHITSAVAQGVKKRQFFDLERKRSAIAAA